MQVPASTSNCGPGFDTLGIALNLYNFVRLYWHDSDAIESYVPDSLSEESFEMIADAESAFRERSGVNKTGFKLEIWGDVPISRGLGSSAVLRAGVVGALNERYGRPLSDEEMVRVLARLDPSPDNVSACVLGGFVVTRTDPHQHSYISSIKFPVAEALSFVVVSPDIHVKTRDAREVLPQDFPFIDAVRSINSASYLVAVFASGHYERLKHAVADFMHEPYRARLTPFVREAISAGIGAGAYTGWLSGSGSSVLCVAAKDDAVNVGKAMSQIYSKQGIKSQLFQLTAENEGMTCV